jgi:hypothetical protein
MITSDPLAELTGAEGFRLEGLRWLPGGEMSG